MKYENLLKNIVLGFIFVIPFIPLVVCSSLFFPYIVGKNILFRILVELMIGGWAILALFNKEYRIKFSWILGGIISLVGIIFFADLLGENPLKSFWSNYERMEGWITLLHLLGYFLVVTGMLKSQKLWQRFFNTSLLVSMWISFYGIFQLMGWASASQGTSRLDTTFGNASYLAIYAVIHIFIALFLWARQYNWKSPMSHFYGGTILLNIYILYHTATRGAILGFFGAILLISLLVTLFEKENKKIKKVCIGFLVGTMLFIGGFLLIKDTQFVKGNQVLNRFASISLQETTTKSRFMIWDMAWQGVTERPILGWGQENFNYVFNKYYDPKMYGQEEWFDRTHNVFMDWLIAGGFLGLLAYLSLFVSLLYYLWNKKYGNNFSVFEKSIFTGLLAGYFVHNFFVFDNITSYILFFTILAFVHNSISFKENTNDKIFVLDKVNEENKTKVIIPLIIFLTVSSLYLFNAKGLLANKSLLSGMSPHPEGLSENLKYFEKALAYNSYANQEVREQLMLFTGKVKELGADQNISDSFFELSKIEILKEIERDSENTRNRVLAGTFFNNFGVYDEGLTQLEKAKELSPKKQSIYFAIGSANLNQGKYDEALNLFKTAYELEPKYDKARELYALSAIYSGDNDLAEELLNGNIPADLNFLNIYKNTGQFTKMILVAEKIAENSPNDPQSFITLAAAYYEVGRGSDAITQLRKAIELDPSFKEQGEGFIKAIQEKSL
ncbi:MAG: O-antigen ligase family protein [Candidatus Pacebacteria bacterium]|nr:O-antigen ligase family protein [Candidatus Paceibacterota bacterium]